MSTEQTSAPSSDLSGAKKPFKSKHGFQVDRSRDVSQPLDRLSPSERLKADSDHLRGTIAEGLLDRLTGSISETDQQLVKFHGIYQQDDRDLRDERRRQRLEPAYQFMVRVRLPGGICQPGQWLVLDRLAREHGNGTLRLTTRQTFQFHGVLKQHLKPTIRGLHETLLDTIAACGDDNRGVMCSPLPELSRLHRQLWPLSKQVSERLLPHSRAYHEIWLDQERVATSETEPLYGDTYLPRKFKIGFVVPPVNDIDVYTQDLGFIAIAEGDDLAGFNVSVGGGMGRTDGEPKTYPRLADVIGFCLPEQVVDLAEQVVRIQRDFGDRVDRKLARFKYTIDRHGLDWLKAELEERLGSSLAEPRPFSFTTNSDAYGWRQTEDGSWFFTLFIENGRILDRDSQAMMTGLREIARVHRGDFRLTPNQNLIIARIADSERREIERLLDDHGLDHGSGEASVLRRHSIACVGLPTCGLAMAESERFLPGFISKLEDIITSCGLDEEPITIRVSGCNNGCSRPYVAEIGLSGRGPGTYNLYLGGGFFGQRLNKPFLVNVDESAILEALEPMLRRYAQDREPDERFGDFLIRNKIVAAVHSGPDFNS
jgi:sulfite reductase (NADPH) hemoprotein beta-component